MLNDARYFIRVVVVYRMTDIATEQILTQLADGARNSCVCVCVRKNARDSNVHQLTACLSASN